MTCYWKNRLQAPVTSLPQEKIDYWAPCLTSPFCALNLTSDGFGAHDGWYCNYVEATSTGVHGNCSQQLFTVEQWLATDTSPYELSAIRSSCPYDLVTKETSPRSDAVRCLLVD
ncbi:PLAT domain-containing protein 1 [Linum perenne]